MLSVHYYYNTTAKYDGAGVQLTGTQPAAAAVYDIHTCTSSSSVFLLIMTDKKKTVSCTPHLPGPAEYLL